VSLIKRYLTPSDLSATDSWRLLDWCRASGAREFTVDCYGAGGMSKPAVWQSFEAVVRKFVVGNEKRERMSGATADDLTRSTELWELNDQTAEALQRAFPGGLFDYDPRERGWFEDPVFYRDGQLMLGVLSHEAFAVLRIYETELPELSAAGFQGHDSLPRAV
jgi:hypothetical protein